jgi:hypothetical protein
LFTFVHDKKSSLEIRLCILTPERMSGRPVDNSRLPKLRAISTLQHGFRASNTRKPSAISTFSIPKAPKRPPFQWFSTRYSLLHLVTPKFFENAKPSAIPTVPFCSALFRQKFSSLRLRASASLRLNRPSLRRKSFIDRSFPALITSAPDETVEQAGCSGTRRLATRPAALFNLLAGRPPFPNGTRVFDFCGHGLIRPQTASGLRNKSNQINYATYHLGPGGK